MTTGRFSLRILYDGVTYHCHLVIDKEAVYCGGKWLPGLDIPDSEAQQLFEAVGIFGINPELPLYCFHEGRDVRGSYSEDAEEDTDQSTPTPTWAILLDGKETTYEDIEAAIKEAS